MKNLLFILSTLVLLSTSCKKDEAINNTDNPVSLSCNCPESNAEIDSTLFGTWQLINDTVNYYSYMVINRNSSDLYIDYIETNRKEHYVFDSIGHFLIQCCRYEYNNDTLTIIGTYYNEDKIEKYYRIQDKDFSNWMIEVQFDTTYAQNLYIDGHAMYNICAINNITWGTLQYDLYLLDNQDLSEIHQVTKSFIPDYSTLSSLNGKFLLTSYNSIFLMNPISEEVIDTILFPDNYLSNDNYSYTRTVCGHNNTIWFFGKNFSDNLYYLVQMDTSRNILKEIQINDKISDITFINDEMYLNFLTNSIHKYDINLEKIIKSYYFIRPDYYTYYRFNLCVSVINNQLICGNFNTNISNFE